MSSSLLAVSNESVSSQKRIEFQTKLTSIANSRFIRIDEKSHELISTNFLTFLKEKIKGILGFTDLTNKDILEEKMIQFLSTNFENIKCEDFSLISKLANYMGLIIDNPKSVQKHKALNNVISNIAIGVLSPDVQLQTHKTYDEIPAQKTMIELPHKPSEELPAQNTKEKVSDQSVLIQEPQTVDSKREDQSSEIFQTSLNDIPKIEEQPIPIGLPNPILTDGKIRFLTNACYRNSANQALRALKPFMERLRVPIEEGTDKEKMDNEKRENIRQALVNLLDALDERQDQQTIEEAEVALRELIFTSELHFDLTGNHFQQQDVGVYLEIILGIVLKLNFETKIAYSIKGKEPSVAWENVYSKTTKDQSILRIQLKQQGDLQEQLDAHLAGYVQNDPLNPLKVGDKQFSEFHTKESLIGGLNDFLVIQLGRALYDPIEIEARVEKAIENLKKQKIIKKEEIESVRKNFKESALKSPFQNTHPIEIPPGDMIKIQKLNADGKLNETLKYQMKGFILRHGSEFGASGHYTAYVQREGQWYHFNDESVTLVSQSVIDKLKKQAYVFFFEKS